MKGYFRILLALFVRNFVHIQLICYIIILCRTSNKANRIIMLQLFYRKNRKKYFILYIFSYTFGKKTN